LEFHIRQRASGSSSGSNTLIGLGGDDLYFVRDTGDVVIEAPNGGNDIVGAFVDYTLPENHNIELLSMLGSGLTGTGRRHQPRAGLILLSQRLNLAGEALDALVQPAPVSGQVLDHPQHAGREHAKSRCAHEWDGWGRLSDDGPGHYNPDPSEDPWGGGVITLHGGAQSSLRPDTVRDNRFDYEAHEGRMQTGRRTVYAGSKLKPPTTRAGAAWKTSLAAVLGKTRRTE
jgi:hypothetical protein